MAVEKSLIAELRSALETFNATGELPSVPIAPEFELHQATSILGTAGVFRGPRAFRQTLAELEESFGGLTFEAERVAEAPGGEIVVFIHVKGRGRASGIEIDNHIAWVLTFRGGEAIRLVIYEDPGEALEAVGLAD